MNTTIFILLCIQAMLLLILILHSHENRTIIKELREIKEEISNGL